MIPRFGRALPFITAVLGIIDVRYTWSAHRGWSIFLGLVTAYLIYLMFKHHHALSPKKTAYYLLTTFLSIAIILVATYLIFF